MSIRRADDTVLLEEVCDVEDAETLLAQVQDGATLIDWSACTHLHAACFQVLLAAGLPVRGVPGNAALSRWAVPILHHAQTTPAVSNGLAPAAAISEEME